MIENISSKCAMAIKKIRRCNTVKDSKRIGGGEIFPENFCVSLSLMATYLMSLILAGSISLDSAFKMLTKSCLQ